MVRNLIELVPKAFYKKCIQTDYVFKIYNPCWTYFEMVELIDGKIRKVDKSVYCNYYYKNALIGIMISIKKSPKLANAIMKLGQLLINGKRDSKYLDLYKIYESFQKPKLPSHSALRHSFSHSVDILSRPSTLTELKKLFGGIEINWNKYAHQKTYWQLFTELLIAVDSIVSSLILENLDEYKMPTQFKRPTTKYWIEWNKEHPDLRI